MKKARNILLTMYIINFCILLTVFIRVVIDKEYTAEFLIGAYSWIISFIEIIIIIANLKKINKKNVLITMTIIFIAQTTIIFCLPAYSAFVKHKEGNYGMYHGVSRPYDMYPDVWRPDINAYGTYIPFLYGK